MVSILRPTPPARVTLKTVDDRQSSSKSVVFWSAEWRAVDHDRVGTLRSMTTKLAMIGVWKTPWLRVVL
jgi:hypothetical protein